MKPVTFAHITFQTGHSFIQKKFSPIPAARETLSVFQGPGYYNLMGLGITAEKRNDGLWTLDLFFDEAYAVRAYACFDAASAQKCWDDALSECQLRQLLPTAIPLMVSPLALSAVKPNGPFLLIELQKGINDYPVAPRILGDFERCLYWRFAQL